MFKRVWTTSIDLTNYYTINNEHNWEDLYVFSQKGINKHALPITVTESERFGFQPKFL